MSGRGASDDYHETDLPVQDHLVSSAMSPDWSVVAAMVRLVASSVEEFRRAASRVYNPIQAEAAGHE
jgi:hypothetical protein